MSETAELSATEVATRLLPLLKEYAGKMSGIAEQASELVEKAYDAKSFTDPLAVKTGRLICLHDTLDKPVTDLAREASGLIEHASLEHSLRGELKLRTDELEEHLRFAGVLVGQLIADLKASKAQTEKVRALAVKSGRYKAPF